MIFGLALALFAAQAVGDTPKFRDPPGCWDGAQNELNHCAWFEYRQADAAMNKQWARTAALMKRLDADYPPDPGYGEHSQYEALLNGQRAWIKFRDAQCSLYDGARGSITPMLKGICLRDVTRARTEQLKSLMLNYEDQ